MIVTAYSPNHVLLLHTRCQPVIHLHCCAGLRSNLWRESLRLSQPIDAHFILESFAPVMQDQQPPKMTKAHISVCITSAAD